MKIYLGSWRRMWLIKSINGLAPSSTGQSLVLFKLKSRRDTKERTKTCVEYDKSGYNTLSWKNVRNVSFLIRAFLSLCGSRITDLWSSHPYCTLNNCTSSFTNLYPASAVANPVITFPPGPYLPRPTCTLPSNASRHFQQPPSPFLSYKRHQIIQFFCTICFLLFSYIWLKSLSSIHIQIH